MEKRLYFVLGDLFVNAIAGVAAAFSARLVRPPGIRSSRCLSACAWERSRLPSSPSSSCLSLGPSRSCPGDADGDGRGNDRLDARSSGALWSFDRLPVVAWVYFLTAAAARSRDGRSGASVSGTEPRRGSTS
jgi:hypothetical protein